MKLRLMISTVHRWRKWGRDGWGGEERRGEAGCVCEWRGEDFESLFSSWVISWIWWQISPLAWESKMESVYDTLQSSLQSVLSQSRVEMNHMHHTLWFAHPRIRARNRKAAICLLVDCAKQRLFSLAFISSKCPLLRVHSHGTNMKLIRQANHR